MLRPRTDMDQRITGWDLQGFLETLETTARTALALLVLPPTLLVYSTLAAALALLGASPLQLHRLYLGFARLGLRVGGTQLVVRGEECIEPGRAYVVVPNHESAWDPLCLLVALPRLLLRFVVKREIMRIPVFGYALGLTGNVTVVRTETHGDAVRIRSGMDRRPPEVSMLFFAEGTRSRDRALHEFKMGAFVTAIAYQLPILPIGIAGTFEIWPKGTLRLRRSAVAIEVGRPIATEGVDLEERAVLRDRTHRAVAELRASARERLGAPSMQPSSARTAREEPRMAGVAPRLKELLNELGTEYETIHHRCDYRAKVTAEDTHTPEPEFAKTVFLCIDGHYAMAVVPADRSVALRKVRTSLAAHEARVAREWEAAELCPDCEIGAAPPFGNLYDLPVYVSRSLAEDEQITFNAGTHEDAIRMRYRDFERIVKPKVVSICKRD